MCALCNKVTMVVEKAFYTFMSWMHQGLKEMEGHEV